MNEEEGDLLASIQASVVEQSEYEGNVLRQATLATAPTLLAGFPPNDDGFEPTVLWNLVSKTRKELETEPDNERLHMKLQLLLHWLGVEPPTATGRTAKPRNKGSNKAQDMSRTWNKLERLEMERSKRLHKGTSQNDTIPHPVETTHTKLGPRKRVPIMKRKYASLTDAVDQPERKKPAFKKPKEELKRLRLQRQKQRAKRRTYDDDSEAELASDKEEDSKSSAKVQLVDSDDDDDNDKRVVCPNCNAALSLADHDDPDEVLARHLSICQDSGPRTRRSQRASPKRKVQPKSQPHLPRRRQTTPPLDDWDIVDYEERVEAWVKNGLEKMPNHDNLRDEGDLPGAQEYTGGLLVPAWINDRLFGYQRTGVQWMWELHQQYVGGIVGDEMGLGKTVQVAAFLGAATSSRKLKSVLVVAPATMLQHWLRELAIWAPGLRRLLIHSSSGSKEELRPEVLTSSMLQQLTRWLKSSRIDRVNEMIDEEDLETLPLHSFCGTGYVVVTTYENLRRNRDTYTNHTWSYMVLDEAQKIRNPDADVTIACKQISTPHRLAMSGTPIQNDLRELWSLFDFVFPGRLGTLPAFEQEFAHPIKRGGYTNATPMQVQLAYRCALMLRDLIEPFLLRRLKCDVKEVQKMPAKKEQVLFCRLTRTQREMYEAYLRSDEISKVMRGSNQLLKATVMLRKISNHPDLVCDPDQAESFVQTRGSSFNARLENKEGDSEDDDEDMLLDEDSLVQRSGKLEVLSKILPLWHKQGHRVLIFCQWKKMLNIIQRFTMLRGWKFGRLDGDTNVGNRQRLVDEFNTDISYMGLLCTTGTGGVGLNLTGANRIIIYDPAWNPSSDAQARERAWRFGQERDVTIYRLITAGTIEEKIYHRQIFKTALSNKILQDPKQRRMFSQRDLKDLFTLSADNGKNGMTETSRFTNGQGVVAADASDGEDSNPGDNDVTLKKVMKSKGLAGIFDHHAVESGSKEKSASAQEMEDQAKRIAREAAKALQSSIPTDQPINVPTWTGTDDTKASRFGSSRAVNAFERTASSSLSSSNLLTSIRQRNDTIRNDGNTEKPEGSKKEYAKLMKRIETFVDSCNPSTDDILEEFKTDVSDTDVAIFRQLLKSVAKVKDGRWIVRG